jgi:putative flippase GtrA
MLKRIIVSARPSHWAKNLVVFAALIFAEDYFDTEKIITTIVTFIAFCAATSTIYFINDIFDRENDKKHPVKSQRPIASGALSVPVAVVSLVVLLLLSIIITSQINIQTLWVICAYLVLNFLYSTFLKNVVIIDVMSISAGFVLRAVAGIGRRLFGPRRDTAGRGLLPPNTNVGRASCPPSRLSRRRSGPARTSNAQSRFDRRPSDRQRLISRPCSP